MDFPLFSVFLALPLEGQPKWQFQALQEELKDCEDSLNFQNPHTPHLTLQFWPEVMEIEYQHITNQVEKIAAAAQPFVLHVLTAGTFGSRGEDRVLFLEPALSEELARVKKSCPWPAGKPFMPHITLARIRHAQRFACVKKNVMQRLKDCTFDIPVDRLRLYAEVDGRKQTPIRDFPLA